MAFGSAVVALQSKHELAPRTLLTSSALPRRRAENGFVAGELCRIVEGTPLCLGYPEDDVHMK